MSKKLLKTKKIKRPTVAAVIVKVRAIKNNTFVTITDSKGDVLVGYSAGQVGYKGSRKSTPHVASLVAAKACSAAFDEFGARSAVIEVRGIGVGRESAMKAVGVSKIEVTKLLEKTRNRHGGCKPKKKRRI